MLRSALGVDILEVAPFFDFGRSWNVSFPNPTTENLASLGLGLRYYITPGTRFIVYWGGRLIHVPNPMTNIQDYGFHVQFAMDLLDAAERFFDFIEPKGEETAII